MKIVILFVSIGLLCFAAAGIIVKQAYKNFHRYLKPGDFVRFYENEEKLYGRVVSVNCNNKSVDITCYGKCRTLPIEDVYPVLGIRYSPYKTESDE